MFKKIKKNRILKNAGWIIGCRIIQSLFGLVIGMLMARYLGPSDYGLVNYAASIVAFAAPIMKLGFDAILVNELINHPDEEGKILGTSLALNTVFSIISCLGVLWFVQIANKGDTTTLLVCALYSLSLLAQAFEMIMYWFQAKLLSKYMSIVSMLAYMLVSGYKIYLLATGKSVHWFAVSQALDYFLIAAVLYVFYIKLGGQKYEFSAKVGKRMFAKSKYYIISSLMVSIFAQTDKVMLTIMLNEAETGYYSAACVCSGVTSFVFSAILDSARPAIFESKNNKLEVFERNIKILAGTIIYLSVVQAVFVTVFGNVLVKLLYGAEYLPAVNLLKIMAWTSIFSYLGAVRNIWMLAVEKQKYLLGVNVSGAVANVGLNALLIPIMGASGAAIASLITQVFSNVIMNVIIKPLRPVNKLFLGGVFSVRKFMLLTKEKY